MKNQDYLYEVLNPWAEVETVPLQGISPRVTDLKGKTIGLFDSCKIASRGVLIAVEEQEADFDTLRI